MKAKGWVRVRRKKGMEQQQLDRRMRLERRRERRRLRVPAVRMPPRIRPAAVRCMYGSACCFVREKE